MNQKELSNFAIELDKELTTNILPFWMNKMIDPIGGYYGQIDGNDKLIPDAPKGGILNARILWTFSSAYIHYKNEEYKQAATRAKDYILHNFFDNEHGGTYWSLNADGTPYNTKKQIYSQAFFIYGLSEYYRAFGDEDCLNKAVELFHLIEKYSFDNSKNGYFEAFDREWNLLDDLRLSEKDANEKKTMNTHLHILEAYTNLYRVWKDSLLAKQLENLIHIFLEKIIDPQNHHLKLFFNEIWESKADIISYGHDIECAWLLEEAAEVLGDRILLEMVKQKCQHVAKVSLMGLQTDGSLAYEFNLYTNHKDYERHWWVQAEAMVGFFNAYRYAKNPVYIKSTVNSWNYIKNNLIDRNNGEWYWSILEDGTINRKEDKAGFWKCPYHNARACLEIIKRIASRE